ncbi:MAG: YidB family protein [Rhizobacter sp.]|nr:YidB family protein [Rhizobacter sp.]
MGLLDSVVGMMGGAGQGSGGNAAMMNAVVSMLAGNGQGGGGLSDILARAQQGGLGDVVSSWIGSGQNLPISADQLQNLLGGDTLANLAQQLGMSQGDTAAQMSQMLPDMVDKLTPGGQMPQGGLGNVGDLLGTLMGR